MQQTSLFAHQELTDCGKISDEVKQLTEIYQKHPEGLADFQIQAMLNWPDGRVSARRADMMYLCKVIGLKKSPFNKSVQVRVITDQINIQRVPRLRKITEMVDKIESGKISQSFGLQEIRKLAAV